MFEVRNGRGVTKLKVSDMGVNFGNTDVTFTGMSFYVIKSLFLFELLTRNRKCKIY